MKNISILPLLLVWACSSQGSPAATAETGQTRQVASAALQSAVGNSPGRRFYEENGWQAVWSDASARALRKALAERAKNGLDRVRFLSDSAAGSPADREAALTKAALAYAGALAHGLTDPAELYEVYTIPRPRPDLAAGLSQALRDGNVAGWLDALAPQDSDYRAISQAYLKMRKAAGAPETHVPSGDLIHPGEHDPRVPQIAAALEKEGFLSGPGPAGDAQSTFYTPRISEAVQRLQDERGIATDGIVGPDTIEALNSGPSDRARAAAVALERLRWLGRNPPPERIDVNTASAMLTYYRNGSPVDRRKVIVGQPGWKTPQLQTELFRLVANPTWTVPKSIEHRQLGHVGRGYLRRHNMVRRDGWLVQLSGPDNALGLVKFDLKDRYAIYLHDTPSKSLFDRNQRQLSHGCIRVHDALGFASMIAVDQGISGEWQKARARGRETYVPLSHDIPVRLLYHPTYVAPSGDVRFEQDTYGWNGQIARKLGFGEGAGKRLVSPQVDDLGP